VGLSRLHDGRRGGGHVLAVDGAGGDAVQRPDVLGDGTDVQRRESVRRNHELELGWGNFDRGVRGICKLRRNVSSL
jgi:hypothetical protein